MVAHLRRHHADICRHWFDDLEIVDDARGTLKLLVREPVQLRYLQRSCAQVFSEAAQAVTGRLLAVRFVGEADDDRDEAARRPGPARATNGAANHEQPGRSAALPVADHYDDMLLSPDYSFDNFVVGPGNRLAHAAAIAVSQNLSKAYNPFFIHSGVGLGKTHLLQAICQAVMRRLPATRIYYVSCNGFMTQFMDAVQAGQMSDFRHRFRNIDLLLIDDIHDLSSRDRTQEEFFHTFNTLYQAGKQIVLSSDAAPNEIPDLEERLSSRFNSGLVARIEKPCFETRVAILKNKAAIRQISLPDDVASYVASKVDSNIRELEGAITSLQGLAMVHDRPIDLELARQAIGENGTGARTAHPTIQEIIEAVTGYYDVKLTDLLSKRRHKSIALPRQVCMWLARKNTRYSLEEIGGYFGGRDHTTVMHAIKTIDERCGLDQALAGDVAKLTESLHAVAE
jgi:chromosomal replication initiator protein